MQATPEHVGRRSRLSTIVRWAILTPLLCGAYLFLMEQFGVFPRAVALFPVYLAYPALWIMNSLASGAGITRTGDPRDLLLIFIGFIVWWTLLGAALGAVYHPFRQTRLARRDPSRCRKCGYDLHGLPEPRCPECGSPFGISAMANKARRWAVPDAAPLWCLAASIGLGVVTIQAPSRSMFGICSIGCTAVVVVSARLLGRRQGWRKGMLLSSIAVCIASALAAALTFWLR